MAAVFLFGAMRTFAHVKGKKASVAFEAGGPIVGAAVVVLAGLYLVPKQPSSFDIVVRVHGADSTVDCPNLGAQAKVRISLGDDLREEPILPGKCIAEFRSIPETFKGKTIEIGLEGIKQKGFQISDDSRKQKIVGESNTPIFVRVRNVPIFSKASILSSDGPFATVGTISVETEVSAESVDVTLKSAHLELRKTAGFNGPRKINWIRCGLAKDAHESFQIERYSDKFLINQTMKPLDTIAIGPGQFHISRDGIEDLQPYWLVFEVEESIEGSGAGHSYIHGDRNLFSQ